MASPRVELLEESVDQNEESHFRFIVDLNSIKDITIDPGLYNVDDTCFALVLVTLMPVFPRGDWNVG